jgi:hypothetical protein
MPSCKLKIFAKSLSNWCPNKICNNERNLDSFDIRCKYSGVLRAYFEVFKCNLQISFPVFKRINNYSKPRDNNHRDHSWNKLSEHGLSIRKYQFQKILKLVKEKTLRLE